jgi:hypothetical protein
MGSERLTQVVSMHAAGTATAAGMLLLKISSKHERMKREIVCYHGS